MPRGRKTQDIPEFLANSVKKDVETGLPKKRIMEKNGISYFILQRIINNNYTLLDMDFLEDSEKDDIHD